MRTLAFRLADLPRVRQLTEESARRLGLAEAVIEDVVIAVNEVATNAVTHGEHHTAQLRLWIEEGSLLVEVHDTGSWTPPEDRRPGPYATNGMGLWVARLLATEISFTSGSEGSAVTMRFAGKG
ncbi:ATP-binding protein [Nonomuraea sp. NPDC050663]|uniref:ATP-binding protein n=1 Tax=Nonomuraea sp. NPDC050663 TaxID=3364370 RepID=UPI0037A8BCDF